MKKVIIISIILLFVICLIAIVFLPVYAVYRREQKVIQSLNNLYINSGLNGWKEIVLDEDTAIKVPDEWIVDICDDRISFISKGQIIVKGIRVQRVSDKNSDETKNAMRLFLEETYSIVEEKTDIQLLNPLHAGMVANYFYKTVFDENGKTETRLLVEYYSDDAHYLFDFGEKTNTNTLQFAEAIAYSFHRIQA